MGNSLGYLLDNYQTLYDLYMDAPEIDSVLYDANKKEIFDSFSDKSMFDVYDEDTHEVIGVGKLFRKKDDGYEFYQQNHTNECLCADVEE